MFHSELLHFPGVHMVYDTILAFICIYSMFHMSELLHFPGVHMVYDIIFARPPFDT